MRPYRGERSTEPGRVAYCGVIEPRPRGERRFVVTLGAIALVGFALRCAYVIVMGPHIDMGLDAAWYVVEGHALSAGHGYVDPRVWLTSGGFKPTANFPPLWSGVLGLADRVGLGTSFRNQLVGGMLGSMTILVTGLVGRRVGGKRVGLAAAAIVAVSPMLIAADGSLMSESLYVLLITGAVLCGYRAMDRPNIARFTVVGVLLGLGALTRSDAMFLAPIVLVALIWRLPHRRASSLQIRAILAVSLAAGFAVPFGAWTAYSSSRMGGLTVATSNSGNMLSGANCGSTYYGDLIGAWDEHCAGNLEPGMDERAWASEARGVGIRYAERHAARLPLVVPSRILRAWGLWDPVQTAHLEVFETRNIRWQLFGWGFDLALLATATVGAFVARRRRLQVAPMVAVVLGVIVTAALSNGNQRFRLDADPVVAVFAANAIIAALGHRSRRSDHTVVDAPSYAAQSSL